jgi:tetratricopeptide (TPR) repeat protein
LHAEAGRRLKASAKDTDALLATATSLIHLGQRESAAQFLKSITDSPYSGPSEVVLEAWNCLLNGQPDLGVLSKFDRWSNLPETNSADYWYTVGILQASLDLPDQAQRSLLKALDADDSPLLDPKAWVLATKIYDGFGLEDAANSARQKAKSLPPPDDTAKSALALLVSHAKNMPAPSAQQ